MTQFEKAGGFRSFAELCEIVLDLERMVAADPASVALRISLDGARKQLARAAAAALAEGEEG